MSRDRSSGSRRRIGLSIKAIRVATRPHFLRRHKALSAVVGTHLAAPVGRQTETNRREGFVPPAPPLEGDFLAGADDYLSGGLEGFGFGCVEGAFVSGG